jgi:hypothetical protein
LYNKHKCFLEDKSFLSRKPKSGDTIHIYLTNALIHAKKSRQLTVSSRHKHGERYINQLPGIIKEVDWHIRKGLGQDKTITKYQV